MMLKPIKEKIGDFNRCVHMRNATSRHVPILWAIFNKDVGLLTEADDKDSQDKDRNKG